MGFNVFGRHLAVRSSVLRFIGEVPQVDFSDHITLRCCSRYRHLMTCQNGGNGNLLAISAGLDLSANDGFVVGRYHILVPEDTDHLLFVFPPDHGKLRDTEVAHDL